MDLRWGLREESQDNHTVIEFCIQEIENCTKMSLGPSFVVCLLLLVVATYNTHTYRLLYVFCGPLQNRRSLMVDILERGHWNWTKFCR